LTLKSKNSTLTLKNIKLLEKVIAERRDKSIQLEIKVKRKMVRNSK
jgi:hypothetical protein